MTAKCELALDTSSLSNVLKSDSSISEFCKRVRDLSCHVVVPLVVVTELLDGTAAGVSKRSLALASLFSELGSSGAIGAEVRQLIELERTQLVTRTPLIDREQMQAILDAYSPPAFASTYDEFASLVTDHLAKTRSEHELRRRRALGEKDEELNREYLAKLMASFHFAEVDAYRVLGATEADVAQQLAEPLRFRATAMLGGAKCLQIISEVFAGVGYWEHANVLGGVHSNNELDGRVLASAAYADVLVCDDTRANRRARFLTSRFELPLRVLRLDEWSASD